MRPLAIAHLVRVGHPHVGGMEAVVHGLAAALVARGHSSWAVTLDHAPTDATPLPEGTWDGVQYRRLRRIGPRRYPFAANLRNALVGADVVHVHGLDGLLHQALRLRGDLRFRVGVSTHGGFLHSGRSLLKGLWLRTGLARALGAADAVWFTSEADRQALSAAGATGPVLPDGVDLGRFSAIVRRPERGVWLAYGRVDRHKGVDDLIRALGILARTGPAPREVSVIGPVPDDLRRELEDLAREQGLGTLVGFRGALPVVEVDAALSRAELALFPSRYEGFGVALVEALAAGVPAAVSPIPAFRDRVTDGVNGYIVPFSDPRAAAARLAALTAPEAVSPAARASARRFSWEEVVEDYERAYEAVRGDR